MEPEAKTYLLRSGGSDNIAQTYSSGLSLDGTYWVGHINCGFFDVRASPSPPPSNHKPRSLDTTHSAPVSQFSCPRRRLFGLFLMIRRRGGGGRAGINKTSQFNCPTLYWSAGGCVRLPARISSGSFFEKFEVRLKLFGSARASGQGGS